MRALMRFSLIAVFLIISLLRASAAERGIWKDYTKLKPGMSCEVVTVVQGVTPRSIPCHVLGVVETGSWLPHRIVIKFDDKDMPVAAGMSGSPVLVKGKIIGALSAGPIFQKEPIAYVTPISDMLSIGESGATSDERTLMTLYANLPLKGESKRILSLIVSHELGISPEDLASLDLSEYTYQGLTWMSEVGGTSPKVVNYPSGLSKRKFKPGDSVSVFLVRGDINYYGTGTVTYTEGDKFLAFGHPMFLLGEVNLPVYTSEVLDLQRSYYVSFKLPNALTEVGALKYDGNYAIVGYVGQRAPMVSMKVEVELPSGEKRTFNFEVAKHRLITPLFAAVSLWDCLDFVAPTRDPRAIQASLRIGFDDGRVLKYDSLMASSKVNPAISLVFRIYLWLRLLLSSPYAKLSVATIDVKVKVLPDKGRRLPIAFIRDLKYYQVDERSYEVLVELKDREGKEWTESFLITYPKYQKRYRLAAVGGSRLLVARKFLKTLPAATPDIDKYFQIINSLEPMSGLYLLTSYRALTLSDKPFESYQLPAEMLDSLVSMRRLLYRFSNVEMKQVRDIPYVVLGMYGISFPSSKRAYSVEREESRNLSELERLAYGDYDDNFKVAIELLRDMDESDSVKAVKRASKGDASSPEENKESKGKPETLKPTNAPKVKTVALTDISDLVEGRSQNVYLSLDGRIYPLRGAKEKSINGVISVRRAGDKLYVLAPSELYIYNLLDGSLKRYSLKIALLENVIPTSIEVLSADQVVIGTLSGKLYLLKLADSGLRYVASANLRAPVTSITSSAEYLYIGLANGKVVRGDRSFRKFSDLVNLGTLRPSAILILHGKLVVGTYPEGKVILFSPDGKLMRAVSVGYPVSALLYFKGRLLIGTSRKPMLYTLRLDDWKLTLADSMGDSGYISGLWADGDVLYTARYSSEEKRGELFKWEFEDWSHLNWKVMKQGAERPLFGAAIGKKDVWVLSSPLGDRGFIRVSYGECRGTFTSKVYNLGGLYYLRYVNAEGNGDVRLFLRVGETLVPGVGWSQWIPVEPSYGKTAFLPDGVKGHYVQFRVELRGEGSYIGPITLSIRRQNNQPFAILDRKTFIVSPGGTINVYYWDPDGDWLRLALYVNKGGRWVLVSQKLVQAKVTDVATPKFSMAQIPLLNKDLVGEVQLQSGLHQFKLLVDDSLSNPTSYLTSEDYRQFKVDATPPEIEVLTSYYDRTKHELVIEAVVREEETGVKSAEIGLKGDFSEEFVKRTPVLPLVPEKVGPNTWKITFRQRILSEPKKVVLVAYDEADNVAKKELKLNRR